jgi:hypothetical protein
VSSFRACAPQAAREISKLAQTWRPGQRDVAPPDERTLTWIHLDRAARRPRTSGAGIAAARALLDGLRRDDQLEAQWSDPSLGPKLLHGARVLVACDAHEVVVRQICQDELAREVVARGATPVFLAPGFPVATDRAIDPQLLPAAREAGAKAMMVMTVAVAVQDVSQPFQIGIGGFGYGGGGGSAGVGISAPVGGGRVTFGLFGERSGHRRAERPPRLDREGDLTAVERYQHADERPLEGGARRGRQGRPVLTPPGGRSGAGGR